MTTDGGDGTKPGRILIDGAWEDAVSGDTYERHDPFNGELVGVYADGDERDAQRAIAAARRAFDDGRWRTTSAVDRGRILSRVAARLREESDRFARILTGEVGQPNQAAFVERAAESLEYYGHAAIERREDAVTEQRTDALGIIAREPVGVVGGLPAWNLPLSLAHKVCPALAVGCTVVVKPAHYSPGAVLALAELFTEAGLPAGVMNIVTSQRDNGAIVGQAIAGSSDVDMITFTGSTETGRKVMQAAANNLKKTTLELGGKSPHVIFADAPSFEEVFEAAYQGIVQLAGQACVAGSRLLVQNSIKDDVVEALRARFADARLGDPRDPKTTVGPLVSERQLERVESYIERAEQEATLVVGGRRPTATELKRGHFIEPALFDDVNPGAEIAQEEVFGPVLAVIGFDDIEDALRIGNQTMYGLASAVWTTDINKALRFAKGIRAGTVWVNTFRGAGLTGMPAGGFRSSGVGREHGPEGLDAFTETKSIHIRIR